MVESPEQDDPFYGWKLIVTIHTNKGDITMYADDMEAYRFSIMEDQTGLFSDGASVRTDELEAVLNWEDVGDIWR